MRYKTEKKPSHTKGDTWSWQTVQGIFREEFPGRALSESRAKNLELFLKLFWEAIKHEKTYLNDVNIWNLSHQKRRDIFLRGYQMWIMYKTSIDQKLNK